MAAMKQLNVTAEGLRKLEEELTFLKTVKREDVKRQLEHARSLGDLSENSEYDEAREEQAKTEARISELEELIKNSVVISDIKTDTVHLGTSVTVLDLEFNEEFTYDIVGSTEADPMKNRISDLSPIGSALIGKKVGEETVAITPSGELKFKILDIAKTEEE